MDDLGDDIADRVLLGSVLMLFGIGVPVVAFFGGLVFLCFY